MILNDKNKQDVIELIAEEVLSLMKRDDFQKIMVKVAYEVFTGKDDVIEDVARQIAVRIVDKIMLWRSGGRK